MSDNVISLSEARERRARRTWNQLADFDAAMTEIFGALDLLETSHDPIARAAWQKICDGLHIIIERERRFVQWTM